MRTLHADLLAAQKEPTRRPALTVRVRNLVNGIERHDFAELGGAPTLGDHHGAAVAGTDVLCRVRAHGGDILQNRVVAPTDASDYSTWTTVASGQGDLVAVAASASLVAVAYVDSAGTGIKVRLSISAGSTYLGEEAAATSPAAVRDLAIALTPDGRIGVAWVTETQRHIVIRTGGSWGSVSSNTPTGSPELDRLAMTFGFDWNMIITGADDDDRETLWTTAYGDGGDVSAGTWAAMRVQQQAEEDAGVSYTAPAIAITDTFHMRFVEVQTFTGGLSRVFRSWLHGSQTFMAGDFTWTSPTPTDVVDSRGLALAVGPENVYETTPSVVRQAARVAATLDAADAVLALEIIEEPHDYRGWVDLDNTGGAFAGPPAPIQAGNVVEVALGYETASGERVSFLPDLNVAGWEYRRDGGVSVLRLLLGSGWEQLRRSRQRAQIVHDANLSWVGVLLRVFLRAGLALGSGSASLRAGDVQPRFTIHPSTSGYEAVRRAQNFIADHIRMASFAAAQMQEPGETDSSVYTFGTDHPMQTYRLIETPPRVSDVHVFAEDAFGAAVDDAAAQHGLGTRADLRDLSAETGAEAAATAAAHLRRRALDAKSGHLVAQPNVGLELFDAVTIGADELVYDEPVVRRVSRIVWEYRRAGRALFRHTVELAPV